jgi:hypothetical protein
MTDLEPKIVGLISHKFRDYDPRKVLTTSCSVSSCAPVDALQLSFAVQLDELPPQFEWMSIHWGN